MSTVDVSPLADIADSPATKSQTERPCGYWGMLVGWWMAWANRKLNHDTLTRLRIAPGDRVLEIGCGVGDALRRILQETPAAGAAGIDPSKEMIEQARKLNHAAIEDGRLRLERATVEALPWPDQAFSQVFAISNFHIWNSPCEGLREIQRVLRPGGRVTICLRRVAETPRFYDQPGITRSELADDLQLLSHIGFENVTCEQTAARQPILFLSGTKA